MSGPVDQFADLRQLLVEPAEETVAGVTLRVQPFAFERMPQMVELIAQIKSSITITDAGMDIDFGRVLAQQYETALQLMHAMSEQPIEWLRKLPTDQAVFVFAIYARVNADFFLQRAGLLMLAMLRSLGLLSSKPGTPVPNQPAASAGPTSSPHSSQTVTAGSTSGATP